MRQSTQIPLVVDLDGALLRTDSLLESALAMARTQPQRLFHLPVALLGGRASCKAFVGASVELDAGSLPLNAPLLDLLRQQRESGRTLVLATGRNQRIAEAIAARLGLFDLVLAGDAEADPQGGATAEALIARFGTQGFDYAGDRRAPLPLWRAARRAIVIGSASLGRQVAREVEVERLLRPSTRVGPALLRALRPHQWVKNLLLLLPLLAAHRFGDLADWAHLGLAFVAFSLTASAVYVLNDLLDLPADRRHPSKCKRPFAAGDLPLGWR